LFVWAPGVVSTLTDHSVLLALVILPECHLAFGFFQQDSSIRIDGSLEAPRNSDDLKVTDYLREKTRMPKRCGNIVSIRSPTGLCRKAGGASSEHRSQQPIDVMASPVCYDYPSPCSLS
jgi:hypothetical protein